MGRPLGLVVAIFVLLALAPAWASRSRCDEPKEKSVEEQLREANRRLTELQGELQSLKNERDRLKDELRAIKVRDELLLKEAHQMRQNVRDAMKARDEKMAQLVETTDKLLRAQLEIARLREQVKAARLMVGTVLNAEKDDAIEISLGARDGVEKHMALVFARELNGQTQILGHMRVVEVKPERSLCKVEDAYFPEGVRKGDRVADSPVRIPLPVHGLVLAVKGEDSALVQISVGSDDGVKKGDRLQAIRADGSKYLGRIEVLETTPESSVCRVIQGTEQEAIRKGDRVQTDRDDVLRAIGGQCGNK